MPIKRSKKTSWKRSIEPSNSPAKPTTFYTLRAKQTRRVFKPQEGLGGRVTAPVALDQSIVLEVVPITPEWVSWLVQSFFQVVGCRVANRSATIKAARDMVFGENSPFVTIRARSGHAVHRRRDVAHQTTLRSRVLDPPEIGPSKSSKLPARREGLGGEIAARSRVSRKSGLRISAVAATSTRFSCYRAAALPTGFTPSISLLSYSPIVPAILADQCTLIPAIPLLWMGSASPFWGHFADLVLTVVMPPRPRTPNE